MKKLLRITGFLMSIYLAYSCNPCNRNIRGAYEEFLHFTLRQRITDDPLIGFFGKYPQDGISVSDETGKVVFPGPVDTDGWIGLYFINRDTDQAALERPLTKIYYLHLDETDTDTIRTEFTLHKDQCGFDQITHLKVWYNDSLSYDSPRNGSITFYK
jgi:hypothetical protein